MNTKAPKQNDAAHDTGGDRPSTLGTIIEPGVAFMFGDMLLFMSGGGVPFGICLGATLLIAGINGTKAIAPNLFSPDNPKKDDKNPGVTEHIRRMMSDIRTPLRLSGFALALVALNAATAGLIIPAVTSAAFAIGNVLIGESLHKATQSRFNKAAQKPKKANTILSGLKTLFTGPDLYIALGLTGAAAMASPIAALAMLPFIATGFGTSLYNALNDKHESNGHPKAVYGISCIGAGIAGLLSGAILPGVANLLFAAVKFGIEAQITDGGLKTVLSDLGKSPVKAFGFIRRKIGLKKTPKATSEPQIAHNVQPTADAGHIPAPLSPQFSGSEKRPAPQKSTVSKPKTTPKAG